MGSQNDLTPIGIFWEIQLKCTYGQKHCIISVVPIPNLNLGKIPI